MCAISGQSSRISTVLIYEAQLLASPASLPYPVAFIARTCFFTVSLPLCRRGNSLPRLVNFQSEAFYDSTGQDFSFFDARGFFANSTNADAQEDVALKHIESASDRIADPIGFLTKPADQPRLVRLLLAFLV